MATYENEKYSRIRVGIITVHRAFNYGSVLQCFALQSYLQDLGYDVRVIDYRQRWTEEIYKPFSLYFIWKALKSGDIHLVIVYWRKRKDRKHRLAISKPFFENFRKHFYLTRKCYFRIPRDFSAYIIGSDQLWSIQCMGEVDRIYHGLFTRNQNSRLIGFSISAGLDSLARFSKRRLEKIVNSFDSLSLRERDNADYVKSKTGREIPVTLDPVLLVDDSVWNVLVNHSWREHNRYVAVYYAREVPYKPNYLNDKANEFAKKYDYEVISLNEMNHSVEDFISIIKYADYIFTSSFHAVVFSVIMETPCFAVELNDHLDVRYVNLLNQVGLSEELFPIGFEPSPFNVDFKKAKTVIRQLRNESDSFLREALS